MRPLTVPSAVPVTVPALLLGPVLAVLTLLTIGVLAPAPAHAEVSAHPFGDPQTVEVGRSGDVVRVQYRIGMADDFTLLGIHLGVLPEDRVLLDGAVVYEDGDQEELEGSEELRAYLLERIEVSTGAGSCTGEVVGVEHLIQDGATLDFTCPRAPASADVTVRTLTDLHPAYRTLATGPDGQRAVYGSQSATHTWSLPEGTAPSGAAAVGTAAGSADGSSTGSTDSSTGADTGAANDLEQSAVLQMGAVFGGVLLLLLVGVLGFRRLRNA